MSSFYLRFYSRYFFHSIGCTNMIWQTMYSCALIIRRFYYKQSNLSTTPTVRQSMAKHVQHAKTFLVRWLNSMFSRGKFPRGFSNWVSSFTLIWPSVKMVKQNHSVQMIWIITEASMSGCLSMVWIQPP